MAVISHGEAASRWKGLFLETLEPHRDLPLLLSGGVDSGTILAGLLSLGAEPRCFSFRVGEVDNPDVAVARKMTGDYGLELEVVTIPRTPEQLEGDVREVIRLLRTGRKTSVQCAQPIMHMSRRIAAAGFEGALVGTGAVALDDRTVMTLLGRNGEEAARLYRAEKLEDRYRDCGTGRMHEMARLCGVTLEEPYSDEPLKSYALALDMAELNWPKQKGIALRAFPEFWRRGYYRRNSSLQVASGVREWHETLIQSPLNRRSASRVVAIYNDILGELEGSKSAPNSSNRLEVA